MKRADLHAFESFRVAAELEHISKAAVALGTSQPTLSRTLSMLERKLGKKLFAKVGRSVQLTIEGKKLLGQVDRAFTGLAELEHLLATTEDTQANSISIGFLRTLGTHYVPELIGRFNQGHPSAAIKFEQNNSQSLEDLLLKRELDLIFTVMPTKRDHLEWRRLRDQRFQVIVNRKHRLSDRKRIDLSEISQDGFIGFSKGRPARAVTDDFCAQAGFIPRIVFETNDSSCIPAFVAANLGVAIIPVGCEFGADVAKIPVAEPSLRRQNFVSWLKGHNLSASAVALRDFAIEDSVHRAALM